MISLIVTILVGLWMFGIVITILGYALDAFMSDTGLSSEPKGIDDDWDRGPWSVEERDSWDF